MGLFKPAWMSSNLDKALRAVNETSDPATLREIVLSPKASVFVRRSAAQKLTNPDDILAVILDPLWISPTLHLDCWESEQLFAKRLNEASSLKAVAELGEERKRAYYLKVAYGNHPSIRPQLDAIALKDKSLFVEEALAQLSESDENLAQLIRCCRSSIARRDALSRIHSAELREQLESEGMNEAQQKDCAFRSKQDAAIRAHQNGQTRNFNVCPHCGVRLATSKIEDDAAYYCSNCKKRIR